MIKHYYFSCQPDDLENSMCFQILGYDIMIDASYKPYLLEVNQCPSLRTDSPLDVKIKRGMLIDIMKKLSLSVRRRQQYKIERKAKMTENL